jgi:hypothetical protein
MQAGARVAVAIAAVLGLAGCRWASDPSHRVQASSPAEVTLKIGEEVQVDGFLLAKFIGVPADSRCPATADCVWAGDAAVAIAARAAPRTSCPDTLHTTLDPTAAVCAGYLISLLELTPYPQVPGPIPAGEYAARLRISAVPAP